MATSILLHNNIVRLGAALPFSEYRCMYSESFPHDCNYPCVDKTVILLILQPFCHFTYVTSHSPILPSLYLCHSSFSNPSVASSTSQFILQSFFRFFYVTSSSLNLPGEPPLRERFQNDRVSDNDSNPRRQTLRHRGQIHRHRQQRTEHRQRTYTQSQDRN